MGAINLYGPTDDEVARRAARWREIEARAEIRYERTMDEAYMRFHYCDRTYLQYRPALHDPDSPEYAEYSEMTGVGNWAALGCPMR